MLNYETLLSSYDDKLTLMQWLKKVEAALKDASAVSFNVNKRGDATLTFSVVFEDGSEIESNPITLQQGESVQSAYIQNGHLHLVLTNGDDLDAGNMFNGDITLSGNLTAVGIQATGTGVKTSVIQQNDESGIDFFASEVSFNNGVSAQGTIASDTSVKAPALTSDEDEISAQKPVVEVMNGYVYVSSSSYFTPVYVGACKNGNKITFVCFGTFTPTTDLDVNSSVTLATLNIPQAIGQKLYPYSQGGLVNVLDTRANSAYIGGATKVNCESFTLKASNVQLQFMTRPSVGSTFAAGTTYIIRYEVTFLLSNNLAA